MHYEPTLWERFNNPIEFTPLTDDELIALFTMAVEACELSVKFDSGAAVTTHYWGIQNSIFNMVRARNLEWSPNAPRS